MHTTKFKYLSFHIALLSLWFGFTDGIFRRFSSKFDDLDDEEPRIFDYNKYLQRPYGTRVDSKSKVETLGKVLKGKL